MKISSLKVPAVSEHSTANLPSRTEAASERLASLEAQLIDSQRLIFELQEGDALKTQFLSNIAHDLRTPLTAIITHAEILRDGILGELSSKQRESISTIITGGRQLLDMIAEILTHARDSSEPLTLFESEFSVHEVVEQVTSLNESLVAKKGLSLERYLSPALPPVRGDRDKVIHVLTNLLGNAFEFTPSGGRVWVDAGMSPEDPENLVMIEVGDTGRGIARDHHELIFREFAQVDSPPREFTTARGSVSQLRDDSSSFTAAAYGSRVSSDTAADSFLLFP